MPKVACFFVLMGGKLLDKYVKSIIITLMYININTGI
jgi:hypothetical protein